MADLPRTAGFTLVEALVSLVVLGIVAVAVMPAVVAQVDANTRNEIRTIAVGLVQERLEALRLGDPAALPTSGPGDMQAVDVGPRRFQVRTYYCRDASYCPPASPTSRHLTVEIWFRGERVYDVETVYTQLL
jgi:type II secretion system protein I